MSQVILSLSRAPIREATIQPVARAVPVASSREIMIIGFTLSLLQVLDGYLTGVGVYHFGTEIEGNTLLRGFMENFGFVPTLIGAKLLALAIIVTLCSLCDRVTWLPLALKGIIAIYLVAAVIPWTYILYSQLL